MWFIHCAAITTHTGRMNILPQGINYPVLEGQHKNQSVTGC